MPDQACGYTRLPVGSEWTPEQKACEAAAWKRFEDNCGGCATELCKEQQWQLYVNTRAQCLGATMLPETGGCCG